MVVLMRRQFLTAAIVLASWSHGSAQPTPQTANPKPVVVDMVAERFSFAPSEVKGTVGVPIEFRLKSDDTDHGFKILGTEIDVRIPKRGKGTATVTFTPARAGRYTIECSHVCGAGHSFMRASIVVK